MRVVDDLATFDNLQPDPLLRAAKKSIQRGSAARKQRSRKQATRRLRFFAEMSFPASEEERSIAREMNLAVLLTYRTPSPPSRHSHVHLLILQL